MKQVLPIRKKLHFRNFDYKGSEYAYFITICTRNKNNHFLESEKAECIAKELEHRIKSKEIILYCYCIMPNHVHLLMSLNENYKGSLSLSNWISAFKRYTSKIFKENFGLSNIWQLNFYEHIVRSEKSLELIADYILTNPIRKNMVENWKEFKYSQVCI